MQMEIFVLFNSKKNKNCTRFENRNRNPMRKHMTQEYRATMYGIQ